MRKGLTVIKRKLFLLVLVLIMTDTALAGSKVVFKGKAPAPDGDMSWWYRTPGGHFWEGMPIGTGRLGAMVLGEVRDEIINLNDETLWSGSPYNPVRKGGLEALPEIRRLIFEGKENQAEELCWKIMGIPLDVQHYNAMSEWRLYFDGHDEVSDYLRELDMDSALVNISYRIGDAQYKRQIFASYPDQVVVMRLTCDKPGRISFNTHFTYKRRSKSVPPGGRLKSVPL
jgi:alpha-L-fucosidase 2